MIDSGKPLEPIPSPKLLNPTEKRRLFNSAVLGYFRWLNEGILNDLETLRGQDKCSGVVGDLLAGVDLERPPEVPAPPEHDRFLVCDADFSQERVVWQARSNPGLVVHGPPGTGKSQTIVNIIADALAHHRTVLMVCQKQAATRVVFEKLSGVGLKDLCIEVHDTAGNRQSVFTEIRKQVDNLRSQFPKAQDIREQLSRQIVEKERLLDEHARAIHQPLPQIEMAYNHVLARRGRLQAKYPSLRNLPILHGVLAKLSSQQVDELCRQVQTNGRLFRQADALNNPWHHRQPHLLPSPTTRQDVATVLAELKRLDAEHLQHIAAHGPVSPMPFGVADFIQVASNLANRLRQLGRSDDVFRLTRCWLKIIGGRDGIKLPDYERRCKTAVALASRVSRTKLDPQWDQVCIGLKAKRLKQLRVAAQRVVDGRGARFALHNKVRYWFASRKISSAIEGIPPISGDSDRRNAAKRLIAHLDAKQAREELAVC